MDSGVESFGPISPSLGGRLGRNRWIGAAFALTPSVIVGYLMTRTALSRTPTEVVVGFALLIVGAVAAMVARGLEPSRRTATILLAVQAIVVLVLWLWWPASMSWLALFWIVSAVGQHLPPRYAASFMLALAVGIVAVSLNVPPSFRLFGDNIFWDMVFFGAVFIIGLQRRSQRQYLHQMEELVAVLRQKNEQLEEAHRQLQAEALQAAALAAAEERNRIAREIHDVLAHSLTVIVVQAQAIKRLIQGDPAAVERQADVIADLAREGLQEARRSVSALRADDGRVNGLDTIRGLVEEFGRHTGTVTHLSVTGDRYDVSPNVWTTLYRVTQEALTNARRHGQAGEVDVRLACDGTIRLTVDDDGVAGTGAAIKAGNGLTGMQERVARLGGRLSYGPRPQGGFHVEVELSS